MKEIEHAVFREQDSY